MKNFYVKMYRMQGNKLYNPCGMDYNYITKDLKTLRGLLNRIKSWSVPANVEKIEIYTFYDVYRDDSYKLVYTLNIPKEEGYYKNIAKYL